MDGKCVFCSMQRSADTKILFSDGLCYVILDKYPETRGHMLVISKIHFADMLSAEDATVAKMFSVAGRAAVISKKVLGAGGINIGTNVGAIAGQHIMHFHIHVIPRYSGVTNSDRDKYWKSVSEDEAAALANLLMQEA